MRRKTGFALVSALVSAVGLVGTGQHAHAQEPTQAPATQQRPAESTAQKADVAELRERGHAAMRSARPADALEAYQAVYAASHDPAMLYNMARAQQALTNYAQAVELLKRFKDEAPADLLAKVPFENLLGEMEGRVHTLTIRCDVPGSEVRLNDRIVGSTPIRAPLRINSGPTDIEVRGEGFIPFKRRLDLRGGAASTIDVDLVRADRSGILMVRSPQAGAAVSIDGAPVGQVPLELPLNAGQHEVVVTKDGFKPSKSRVIVVTGQRKETSIDLAGTPGLLTRWWFWTSVGVVLAGGVASYIALTTEKDPPNGSIVPGQASLGLSY